MPIVPLFVYHGRGSRESKKIAGVGLVGMINMIEHIIEYTTHHWYAT